MHRPHRIVFRSLLLAALLAPGAGFGAEAEGEPRFRVNASLQTSSTAVSDPRFSLRGQLFREASPVTVRDTGNFLLSASFSPRAATCLIPDLLFRDRFEPQSSAATRATQ